MTKPDRPKTASAPCLGSLLLRFEPIPSHPIRSMYVVAFRPVLPHARFLDDGRSSPPCLPVYYSLPRPRSFRVTPSHLQYVHTRPIRPYRCPVSFVAHHLGLWSVRPARICLLRARARHSFTMLAVVAPISHLYHPHKHTHSFPASSLSLSSSSCLSLPSLFGPALSLTRVVTLVSTVLTTHPPLVDLLPSSHL